MKYAQLVLGPAGSGKSTYCQTINQHCELLHRSVNVINLDPAAEDFKYPVAWDIRDLVSLDDVTETLGLGPNGGLIYCLEYLINNMEVLEEVIGDFSDDYLLFDCPGQIELYTHIPVMKTIVAHLQGMGYHVAAVYLLDSQFMSDASKFFSGILSSLSSMIALEVPYVSVLSKMDLIPDEDREKVENYLDPDMRYLLAEISDTNKQYARLSEAIASLLDEYSLVNFLPLNRDDEESIERVLYMLDHVLQYGEDEEIRMPKDEDDDPELNYGEAAAAAGED
eukprot:m.39930 g.39930  ORF g.39930 m.39930 type:complete len:280 (+) comp10230_c0_seq3:17-856(+)